jgi:uncharacterized protein YhbP (UPF0306 family)
MCKVAVDTGGTNGIGKRILKFLRCHHVMTLATCCDNRPWCCQCFYVYVDRLCGLVFTSDASTRHIIEALQQPHVAGSIVLESKIVGILQGIQLEGTLIEAYGELLKEIKTAYIKRFPFALLMDTKLWFLELTSIKMTDNRLGFGKKLFWSREESKNAN